MFQINIVNIFDIRNVIEIDFSQKIVVNHTLYHIVGRTHHIIGDGTGLNLWIHFVGFVFFVYHIDTGIFFKHLDGIRI